MAFRPDTGCGWQYTVKKMDNFAITIIGAGIVGLATAARLAPKLAGKLLLVERHESFGRETSSRNSEVIHAGIYYPENSLKARLCVSGSRQIYQICQKNNIAHRRLGKLIVATSTAEEASLNDLFEQGRRNGAANLKLLNAAQSHALEPQVKAQAALFSPDSGIVDSHKLLRFFYHQAKNNGATIAFHAEITRITPRQPGFQLDCSGPAPENYNFNSDIVINCAGLDAARLSRSAGFTTPNIHYAKGSYFSYNGKSPLAHLVYPAPPPRGHGLGIHATIDLGGRLRFGPDLKYCDQPDYQVDATHQSQFTAAIKRYLPTLDTRRLTPDMAGIRPRLQGPDDPFSDFIIRNEIQAPGFINLLGIESPGLTAAPAIAAEIARMLNL